MKTVVNNILIFFLLIGCETSTQSSTDKHSTRYIEEQNPFTGLFYYRIKNNSWIREPENILMVHETIKKISYKKYLTTEKLNQSPFVQGDFYFNTPLKTKIDSLVFYYDKQDSASTYYKEFWKRRVVEENDSIVNLVLTEIQQLINHREVPVQEDYVNTHLLKLIKVWHNYQPINTQNALEHFEYFRTTGMHQSAYNLLYENMAYADITVNRDSLEKMLKNEVVNLDTIKRRSVFIEDNTK